MIVKSSEDEAKDIGLYWKVRKTLLWSKNSLEDDRARTGRQGDQTKKLWEGLM